MTKRELLVRLMADGGDRDAEVEVYTKHDGIYHHIESVGILVSSYQPTASRTVINSE